MLIPTKNNTSNITDMRLNTLELLNQVEKKGLRYIFQRSTPRAVLISIKDYQKLLERLEDLIDEVRAKEIEHEDRGVGLSLKEVQGEYSV